MLVGTASMDIYRLIVHYFPNTTSQEQNSLLNTLWASLDKTLLNTTDSMIRVILPDNRIIQIHTEQSLVHHKRYMSTVSWSLHTMSTRMYPGRHSQLLIGITHMLLEEQKQSIMVRAATYAKGFEWCIPKLIHVGHTYVDGSSHLMVTTAYAGTSITSAVADGTCTYQDLCDLACQWICIIYVLTRETGLKYYDTSGTDSVLIHMRPVETSQTYQLGGARNKTLTFTSRFQLFLGNVACMCTNIGGITGCTCKGEHDSIIKPPKELATIIDGVDSVSTVDEVLSVIQFNIYKQHLSSNR